MDPACIRHTDLPGTSTLFADFTYHFDRVSRFYRHDPHNPDSLAAAAAEIQYPDDRRAALVKTLTAQNGPSKSIDLLAKPGTVAVVTGQQVGLFSGPAYTIYKALTAARLASDLSARGIPAVPVFWLATEDHDFAEVNHAWVFGRDHQPVGVSIDAPAEAAGRQRPVGGIRIERAPIEPLRQALVGFPHGEEVVEAVEQAYRPGVTMGEGFRALLSRFLGQLGLLFLDPLDPAIRKIGAPLVAKALRSAPELKARLLERNRQLTDAGYHAQVHLDEKTSLFFLLENGERVPLRRKDGDYHDVADRAAEVSPNALLRPVMQDYLLPTVAYIGGPAELAYMAQSQVLYEGLLGRMPVVMSRGSFTLLDARAVKLLERYRMTVTDAFVNETALKGSIAHALVPESVKRAFESTAEEVSKRLASLRTELEAFDHTLASALDKSGAKILYQLNKTQKKTERESLRRDERAQADANYLGGLLYPHKHLQERFYSILPFLAEHGLDLVDSLYETVRIDCPDHRVYTI